MQTKINAAAVSQGESLQAIQEGDNVRITHNTLRVTNGLLSITVNAQLFKEFINVIAAGTDGDEYGKSTFSIAFGYPHVDTAEVTPIQQGKTLIQTLQTALQQLELSYFAEYGGNSVDLEDAIRRAHKKDGKIVDQLERELIEAIMDCREALNAPTFYARNE